MMEKELIKQVVCDFIDSADEVQDLSISDETEEIDMSTLEEERVVRRSTGRTEIRITVYKE